MKKEKSRTASELDRQRTDHPPHKRIRCVSLDHNIAKFPKPPEHLKKAISFSEKDNCASQKKESEGSDDNNNQNIYAYMVYL